MRCILRKETDPYFNIAAEEYVLKHLPGDTFMLWRNEPSVIIGKHQNTFAEINLDFINKNGIKVIRRITGGGAVYHDLGNLNFTFVTTGEQHNLINFDRFTDPVIHVLSNLGIEATKANKNSLYIEGLKISGNAEHVFKNRVLHHGTLLFSSNLENLEKSIRSEGIEFNDKAVKSIRSQVTNISYHINRPLDIDQFTDFIMNEMLSKMNNAYQYSFTEDDITSINKLIDEKYKTWEWNYSYSPTFSFSINMNLIEGPISLELQITNGIIVDVLTLDKNDHKKSTTNALESLRGVHFREKDISRKLEDKGAHELAYKFLAIIFKVHKPEHFQNKSV